MKEIGGYFELELPQGNEYHAAAIRLNSGRSCLAYLLQETTIGELYLPRYICDSVVDIVKASGVSIRFYSIDHSFEIDGDIHPTDIDRVLYVNYFGFKDDYLQTLVKKYGHKLIVDNSQAFFAASLPGIDTFYSPRKFFGVADGGYLYTDAKSCCKLPQASSANRSLHLLGRVDEGANAWYSAYLQAEAALADQGIQQMSQLTMSLLQAVDYERAKESRNENYDYLHRELASLNSFALAGRRNEGPMVYLYATTSKQLRDTLRDAKVYVASYWSEISQRDGVSDAEKWLADNCLPLPVDQRYEIADMKRIVTLIKEHEHE